MFYKKALRGLTEETLMAIMKSGWVEKAGPLLVRLSKANDEAANVVVQHLLQRLIAADVVHVADMDNLESVLKGRLSEENLLLLWSLVNEDKVQTYLKTWRPRSMKRILKTCCFLRDSRKSLVIKPFLVMCVDLVRKEIEAGDGEYSKTIVILRSHILSASPELPDILKDLFSVLSDSDDMDDVMEENLFAACADASEKAFTASPTMHVAVLWVAMARLATKWPMGETRRRNRLLTLMCRILCTNPKVDLPFKEAFGDLWDMWNPSLSWELSDSFLELLAAGIIRFDISGFDVERVRNATSVALKSSQGRDSPNS
jgi:hypothetical protein